MAYTSGSPLLIANPTQNTITIAGTAIAAGKCVEVTPDDAVAVTLTAGLTKGTPATSLTVSALPQAVQKGTSILITQTIFGVAYAQQCVASATAAASATSVSVTSFTPVASFTTSATLLANSQGEVASAVAQGCAVMSTLVITATNQSNSYPMDRIEKGVTLLLELGRAVLSAGADTWAAKGL